jgi:hypothetical protein
MPFPPWKQLFPPFDGSKTHNFYSQSHHPYHLRIMHTSTTPAPRTCPRLTPPPTLFQHLIHYLHRFEEGTFLETHGL